MNKIQAIGFSLLSFAGILSCKNNNQGLLDSESYKPYYAKPAVSINPKQIIQGQTAFVRVEAAHSLKKPYFIFQGKKFRMFKEKAQDSAEKILYTGLLPTTPDCKDKCKVIVSDCSENNYYYGFNKNFSDTLEIEVKDGNFVAQHLSLGGKGRELSTKETLLKKAERDVVIKALDSISDIDYYEEPPYEIPTKGLMTTEYGARRPYFHNGVDIKAPEGQPIKSILGGKVLLARKQKYTGNGGIVIIDHGRFKSVFLHMSAFCIKEGDTIKKGQIIGKVGNTGASTGPHLHFGIYPNGIPVNPEQWLNTLEKDKSVIKRLSQQAKELAQKSIKNEISMNNVKKFVKQIIKIK